MVDICGRVIDMTSTENTTTKPASESQITLITNLCNERGIDLAQYNLTTLTGGRGGTASELITALFKVDKVATEGTTPARIDPEPGFYRVKTDQFTVSVVRVVLSKSGNWYAKLAVKPAEGSGRKSLDWDYLGKRIDMRNAVRMTEAEAGKFLKYCVRCGAELTVPESIERGLGPVCATKVGM